MKIIDLYERLINAVCKYRAHHSESNQGLGWRKTFMILVFNLLFQPK